MKPTSHYPVIESVVDSNEAHPLMVREERLDDVTLLAIAQASY
jgi:hypothetical protein